MPNVSVITIIEVMYLIYSKPQGGVDMLFWESLAINLFNHLGMKLLVMMSNSTCNASVLSTDC